ncbi:MAG TPA: cytidine deaminase [Bacteroidetes bacterium]|nr:cytidine deaminase [Bacteroidota bacterium]
MSGSDEETRRLLDAAADARRRAVAPYSRFRVGAALEDAEGNVWTGANVESSSFGLSICAERVALFKALSEGVRSFRRIAIAAHGKGLVPPCGACRQVLQDHAPGIEVILYDPRSGEREVTTLEVLYPSPFGHGALGGEEGE